MNETKHLSKYFLVAVFGGQGMFVVASSVVERYHSYRLSVHVGESFDTEVRLLL